MLFIFFSERLYNKITTPYYTRSALPSMIIPMELKRLSVLLVKVNPTCVVSFMHNVLSFSTSWPAKAAQHRGKRFCAVRITIACNARLVNAHFSCVNLVSLINNFGVMSALAALVK